MARNWTPEERKKQAEKIREWKPWQQSTGPRTEAGKAAASENAYKSGFRSADMRELRALLRKQRNYVRNIILGLPCEALAKQEALCEALAKQSRHGDKKMLD